MNPHDQSFQPPRNVDEIRELAHLHATEDLSSQQEELEKWLTETSEENRRIFHEEVEAVTLLTLAVLDEYPAPALDLDAITSETKPAEKTFPPGFFYQAHDEGEWQDLPVKGARIKELSNQAADGFTVMLLEMEAGCHFPSHHHKGSEQVYLLDGDLVSDDQELSPGDFLRAAADTHHSGLYSETGCHALIITAQNNYPSKAIHLYSRLSKGLRKVKEKLFK